MSPPPASNQFTMRPMTLDDVDTVAGWLQDAGDLSLFDRNLPIPPSATTLREGWKADLAAAKIPAAYWFVIESREKKPVAVGGLQSINYVNGDAVLPILVAKAARGQGLGLRIAIALLDMAFDRLRLRRVTTFFRSDNLRTGRLIERLGFRAEGRMREAWYSDGRHLDCMVVGLLSEEWRARKPALCGELDDKIALVVGAATADRQPTEARSAEPRKPRRA